MIYKIILVKYFYIFISFSFHTLINVKLQQISDFFYNDLCVNFNILYTNIMIPMIKQIKYTYYR